jgi:hypothetical protein
LDDLKVFFDQQHDCDMLEKRILKNDEHDKDHTKKDKNKGKKANKKRKKNNDDDDADKARKSDRKPSAKPKCNIASSGIGTKIVGP